MPSVIFNSSQTWICPSGITLVRVECWGGGGCGGHSTNPAGAAGGGGGGGAYSQTNNYAVTPGSGYELIVGSGGLRTVNNGKGGFTTFHGSGVRADGGNAGASGFTTSNAAGGFGGSFLSGIGELRRVGGDGGGAFYSASPGNEYGGGGGGGGSWLGFNYNGNNNVASPFGIGGQPYGTYLVPASGGPGGDAGASGLAGLPGSGLGGGGGGAGKGSNTIAAGGPGRILLTYSDPPPLDIDSVVEFIFEDSASVLLNKGVSTSPDIILEHSTSMNVQQGITIPIEYIFEVSTELTQTSPLRIEAGPENIFELGVEVSTPNRVTSTMPLFLKTEELGVVSGAIPLFTFSTSNSGISSALPLYLESASGVANYPSGLMPLFLLGPDSIGISGTMPLYLNGTNNTLAGSLDLFICNEIVFSGIPLYTIGGVSDGSYSMAGAAVGSGDMVLFINRPTSNILPLYLRGPGTLDSGVLDLYMAGASPSSGELPMAIPVTYDRKTSTTTLYTHGW